MIEGGDIVWMEGDTFALTNFHLSDPSHGSWPCSRYTRATGMLADNSEPTIDRVAAILNATHVPSTRYSVVCDLVAETATVYYAGNFNLSAGLNVEELCRTGSERILISSLIDDQN